MGLGHNTQIHKIDLMQFTKAHIVAKFCKYERIIGIRKILLVSYQSYNIIYNSNAYMAS